MCSTILRNGAQCVSNQSNQISLSFINIIANLHRGLLGSGHLLTTSFYSNEHCKSVDMNSAVKFCRILSFTLESLFLCIAKAMPMS